MEGFQCEVVNIDLHTLHSEVSNCIMRHSARVQDDDAMAVDVAQP